jgi:hypothetical protein
VKLTSVRIERFRNFVEPQDIAVEDDVTCFVGKNESGKTTVLEALHRLNPANLRDARFNLTTEYPRWRLSRDRRSEDLDKFKPIEAIFELEDTDLDACAAFLPARPPDGTICTCAKSYDNTGYLALVCPRDDVIRAAAAAARVEGNDVDRLLQASQRGAAITVAREAAKTLRDKGENERARAFASFPVALESYGYLLGDGLTQEHRAALVRLLPRFFYFSDYELLPGERDLHMLAEKATAGAPLEPEDESVLALLAYAGAKPDDFLGGNYDQRKAELQASALDLTRKVFTYWTQNSDLEVDFDTELEDVGGSTDGTPVMHRILKVLMRDNRHGGIATNFETRSTGFRWFFSFLSAFSRYQESDDSIIVLLDEPSTSLHGEAQKDFLRFIHGELGMSKQVLYTTHSQHMVDPARYEKLRAVEDRATRDNPDIGVVVTPVGASTDRDTLLPVQAALGYSISQHLVQDGGRHLVVEGGSHFTYLQQLSEHLQSAGRPGLDPRLRVLPVGGPNVPAFVALMGRDLEVSVLLAGDRAGPEAERVLGLVDDGAIRRDEIVVVGDVPGVGAKADVEDLFDPVDYLRLYSWAYQKEISPKSLPNGSDGIVKKIEAVNGTFDPGLPAHALTANHDEFFESASAETLTRFQALFELLNATLPVAEPAASG